MPDSPVPLARLKRRLERLERPRLGAQAIELVSLGGALDARLGGGLARQALHEVVAASAEDAASACAFALMLAWRAARDRAQPVLWVTTDAVQREQGALYGPGLAALGANPDRLILIHAPDELAALSAAADIVRAMGVAAMVVEAGAAKRLDLTASRRLALAAAQSGVMGLVLRGPGTAFASAASTRWLASAAPSTALPADAPGFTALAIELLRHRGGVVPFSCILEWDNDIAVPAYVPQDLEGVVCGYHLTLIRPNAILGKYLFRLFQSRQFNSYFNIRANGVTRFGLPQYAISNPKIPVPSMSEQVAIATFLDDRLSKIDALITKKKSLVKLLDEKRNVLISLAVSKGLDHAAPMYDSGIAWLGDIPMGWETKRLKYVTASPLKYGANEIAEFEEPTWPRYIRITDVKEDGTLREETFRSLPMHVAENYLLEEGDILLARSGATIGKSFIYRNNWGVAAYAGYLIRFRCSNKINPDFAYYFFHSKSYWDWIRSIFIQSTIQNVSAEKYANFIFALPPIKEQVRIVKTLDKSLEKIKQQSKAVGTAIDKLREYRSGLITAAVTGKIKVS